MVSPVFGVSVEQIISGFLSQSQVAHVLKSQDFVNIVFFNSFRFLGF